MAQHIHALMQAQGRVALEEIPELREALQYANHGGKLSRQSIIGLDWVKESARKSQVAVIGAGVQGSISTLPGASAAVLCAAVAESGDRVAGIVRKHTVVAKGAEPSSLLRMHELGPGGGGSVLQLELVDPAVLEVIQPSPKYNPNLSPSPAPIAI